MSRRDEMPLFQPVDLNRPLIGQRLLHAQRWAASYGKEFEVVGISVESGWYGDPDGVKCIGYQIKKDGTPGQVAGECVLRFDEVPTVDFEMLLRRYRNEAVLHLKREFALMNLLRNVITERGAKVAPGELQVDFFIGEVLDSHAAVNAKDDDD